MQLADLVMAPSIGTIVVGIVARGVISPGIVGIVVAAIGSPYDFSHTSELIECARESTDAWLAGGGLERRAIPDQMRPHTHAK